MMHAIVNVREKAPLLGGSFAVWCGSFGITCNGLKYFRQTDDAWNDTIGGGLIAFMFSIRSLGVR